jgi:hypothetical protein
MLSAEQIQGLKRVNISVSSEKTKTRFEEIFKPAKIKQKQAVRELAGVTSQVAHNIYTNGNISAKMVIAVSQVMNVNPFYLTGEADEPGAFSDETLRDLLMKHKYRDLVAGIELPEKKKRPYTRRASTDAAVVEDAAEEEAPVADDAAVEVSPSVPVFLLEEADQMAMLRALHIQVKAGIAGAKERLEQINQVLLA